METKVILHITHVPLVVSTTSMQIYGNRKAALPMLTLPYQNNKACSDKKIQPHNPNLYQH